MLSTLALIFSLIAQPPSAPAQGPATLGKWDFVMSGETWEGQRPIRWREHPFGIGPGLVAPYSDQTPADVESAESEDLRTSQSNWWPAGKEVRDTFGAHSILLPGRILRPGEQNRDPRGVTLMIGRGAQYYAYPPPSPAVNTHSWNPHLMWRYSWDSHYDEDIGRLAYGLIGYSKDWDLTTTTEMLLYKLSSNLFCSGHTILHNGRLFVVGGTYVPPGSNVFVHGLTSLFSYDVEQWANSAQGVQAGWKGTANNDYPAMFERRWYASPVLLQDGFVLITGGILTTAGSLNCSEQGTNPRYTSTFELWNPHTAFDPQSPQTTIRHYDLATVSCLTCGGTSSHPCLGENDTHPDCGDPVVGCGCPASRGFNCNDDQRWTLGNEYPRLHMVSFWTGSQLTSRVAYNGPYYPTYLLNTHARTYGCWPEDTAQIPFEWKRVSFSGTPPSVFYKTRAGGTSVLMPRIDEGAINPQNAEAQALNEVLRIGGENGGDLLTDDEFALLYRFSYDSGSSSHKAAVTYEEMQPYDNDRPGSKHIHAAILPTGDLFVAGGMKIHASGHGWDVAEAVRHNADILDSSGVDDWTDAPWVPMQSTPQGDIDTDYDEEDPNVGLGMPDSARMYHSTILLQPDGRLLAAGTDMDGPEEEDNHRTVRNLYPQTFSPKYLYKTVDQQPDARIDDETERPVIVELEMDEADYSQVVEVQYTVPEGREIVAVNLVRPSSVTHSINFDQRLVRCNFVPDEGDPETLLHVTMPWDPQIAPPGWYMVFLVDDQRRPSIAGWIKLEMPAIGECPEPEEEMSMGFEFEGAEGVVQAIETDSLADLLPRDLKMAPVAVEIRQCDTGRMIGTYRLSINGMGSDGIARSPLYADLAPGTYEFYVRPQSGYLGKRFVAEAGPGAQILASLLSGDVNGDNAVDAADMQALQAQYGQSSDRGRNQWLSADLNKDGTVNDEDWQIVQRNLGRAGDR